MDVFIFLVGVSIFVACAAVGHMRHARRYNVVRVKTPAGVIVSFDCARCETRGQTWAVDYAEPLCWHCSPCGMPS